MERAMSAAAGEANIHTAAAERHLWLGLWLGGRLGGDNTVFWYSFHRSLLGGGLGDGSGGHRGLIETLKRRDSN